jgi:PKD repeat protein
LLNCKQIKEKGIKETYTRMRLSSALKYCFAFIAGFVTLFSSYYAFTNASNTAGGYTDAPGESNCTSCHTGGPISSPSSVIKITVNGSNSFFYKPDSTYTIAVSASKSGINKWGFQATTLKDSDNSFTGTMSATSFAVGITSATISGQTRYYAEQTSSGTAGTNGRSWSFSWKAPHTNVGSISIYVTACGANGNGLVTGDAIYGNKFTLNFQPQVPVPGFTFSPVSPCEGDTVYIKDTSQYSPTSWSWTFTGGTPSTSTLQNPKVVFKVWGGHKMTLVATNTKGSALPYTKIITVNQKPLDTVYHSRPLEFCIGDSTKLTAYLGSNYLWSTGDTTQSIVVRKSGIYYVIVTGNTCTVKSKNVVVYVHPKPVNVLTRTLGGDTLCFGDAASFSLNTNGKTYKYYNGKTLLTNPGLTLNLPNLSGTGNKIYSIAFDALGCKSDTSTIYKEIVKVRLAAPVLSAGKSTTQSASATWAPVKGAIGYEVSEDSGKTWKSTGGTPGFTHGGMDPNTSIALKVRAIDMPPCGYGLSATIVISSLPCSKKTYVVNYDTLICPKSVANVTFSNISASRYGLITNGITSKDTVYSYYLLKDSTPHYAIYDSSESNCGTLPIDLPVKVIKYPKLVITADKSFYCGQNDPATITGNGNFEEYDVYYNGKLIRNDIINSYTTDSFVSGDKIMMLAKYQGCISDSSNIITLNRYDAAEAFFNYKNQGKGSFSFINKSKSAASQIWYFGDGGTDTSENPVHTYITNKIYTVWLVVTSAGGCKDSISKTITASGIPVIGIDNESLAIIPNPFVNSVTISFTARKQGAITLMIIDLRGNTVKKMRVDDIVPGKNEMILHTEDLKPGSYFLNIYDGKQSLSRQIIKN